MSLTSTYELDTKLYELLGDAGGYVNERAVSGVWSVSGLNASGWPSDEVGREKASWVECRAWPRLVLCCLLWNKDTSQLMVGKEWKWPVSSLLLRSWLGV